MTTENLWSNYTAAENVSTPEKTPPNLNRRRVLHEFLVVWLDANVTTSNKDSQNTLQQLRTVVSAISLFNDPDDCVDFLSDVQTEKVFLITSSSFAQQLLPFIHPMAQLSAIYLFCADEQKHEEWIEQWSKIKGVHSHIRSICEGLQRAVKQCNQDSIPVSFTAVNTENTSSADLNRLDASFMYTQLIKSTLLNMEDSKITMQDLVKYCQSIYADNLVQLKVVEEFNREYRPEKAIWWYTRHGFIYEMLNRSLRLLEAHIIVNMGFFFKDLHRQIQTQHQKQIGRYGGESFVVYRGQRLSITDFEKLKKTQGGLMSFNSFLSTSRDQEVSLMFASSSSTCADMVGILFVIIIDPKVTSAPFTDIANDSQFSNEQEILFTTHTVFRIGDVKSRDEACNLFEVQLTLTDDADRELRQLAGQIQEEIKSENVWEQLGRILIKISQPDKAEELFLTLLGQKPTKKDRRRYYHRLGAIKNAQGDFQAAILYYERAISIEQEILPADHSSLMSSFNGIGLVYHNMGDYSKAISYLERALSMKQKTLSDNDPSFASTYNNIGLVYEKIGEYSKALVFYEKALAIEQNILLNNHPDLATYYSNIALVYKYIGEYCKALSHYEKALSIEERFLPSGHPGLADSYVNIGQLYDTMGQYSKALHYYEKALCIEEKSLSVNHPSLVNSYNSIGVVYSNMGEYGKALSYYEKALAIGKKSLPDDHRDLATSHNCISVTYSEMGEYLKALPYCEKALCIFEKILPGNHPFLGSSYSNIGAVYGHMKDYSNALLYFEKALSICESNSSGADSSLPCAYNNISQVYSDMEDHSSALSYLTKALSVGRDTLPTEHPLMGTIHNNLGKLYSTIGELTEAITYYEKAISIKEKTLPSDHPALAVSYRNIAHNYLKTEDYSKALFYYDKALKIEEKTLPVDHPSLTELYELIGKTYYETGESSKALFYCEKALSIEEKKQPVDHLSLATSYGNIGQIYYYTGDYHLALFYHKKGALSIESGTLPAAQPTLGTTYCNMGAAYFCMEEYAEAFSFFQKALDIQQCVLPAAHPDIQNTLRWMDTAEVYL